MAIGAGSAADGGSGGWPLAESARLAVAADCAPSDVELVADLFFGAGASAVAELDHLGGDDHAGSTDLSSTAGSGVAGASDTAATVATVVTVVADLSPDESDRLSREHPGRAFRVLEPDAAWDSGWRDHARSWVCSDRVLLRPDWLAAPPGSEGLVEVRIEPGNAFGSGSHPTTRLCVDDLVHLLDGAGGGVRVLDVGCGTGVLSVVAALLGALHVTAVDIDPVAVEVTEQMAALNGVADRIEASSVPLATLAALDGRYDLVLANLLVPVIEALSVDLERVLAPGGRLVVSGVLVEQVDRAEVALRDLDLVSRRECDGWASLVFQRHDRPASPSVS